MLKMGAIGSNGEATRLKRMKKAIDIIAHICGDQTRELQP
jgi:hypothetical protein